MARTSRSSVKDAFTTELSDSRLDAYIDDANVLVDELLQNQGLGSTVLKKIEKYLAIWFATSDEPVAKQVSTSGASVTYTEGEINRYLARAIRLDSTDILKKEFLSNNAQTDIKLPSKRT